MKLLRVLSVGVLSLAWILLLLVWRSFGQQAS
jgi:hypothetical protein